MEQIIFKSEIFQGQEEVLTLKGLNCPLSLEETITYLRVISNQLEDGIN